MMSEKVGLYITFWAAPGKADELLNAVRTMLDVVKDEVGTLAYGFHTVSGEREGVSVYEIYANAEAQQVHGESSAIATLKARLPHLLAAPPERHKITPVAGSKGLPF
jgi:quinol monooxygenase YgiN